jgi:hypothetical protein
MLCRSVQYLGNITNISTVLGVKMYHSRDYVCLCAKIT